MCTVTTTELRKRLSYYLELSTKERVHVTKNNKTLTTIYNGSDDALAHFLSLRGKFEVKEQYEDYRDFVMEEVMKRWEFLLIPIFFLNIS